jgi:hypothetical protein
MDQTQKNETTVTCIDVPGGHAPIHTVTFTDKELQHFLSNPSHILKQKGMEQPEVRSIEMTLDRVWLHKENKWSMRSALSSSQLAALWCCVSL